MAANLLKPKNSKRSIADIGAFVDSARLWVGPVGGASGRGQVGGSLPIQSLLSENGFIANERRRRNGRSRRNSNGLQLWNGFYNWKQNRKWSKWSEKSIQIPGISILLPPSPLPPDPFMFQFYKRIPHCFVVIVGGWVGMGWVEGGGSGLLWHFCWFSGSPAPPPSPLHLFLSEKKDKKEAKFYFFVVASFLIIQYCHCFYIYITQKNS